MYVISQNLHMIMDIKGCKLNYFFFFSQVTPNCRVALRNDSYTLHKILPNKVRNLKTFFSGNVLYTVNFTAVCKL